jgi:hypothetical protein
MNPQIKMQDSIVSFICLVKKFMVENKQLFSKAEYKSLWDNALSLVVYLSENNIAYEKIERLDFIANRLTKNNESLENFKTIRFFEFLRGILLGKSYNLNFNEHINMDAWSLKYEFSGKLISFYYLESQYKRDTTMRLRGKPLIAQPARNPNITLKLFDWFGKHINIVNQPQIYFTFYASPYSNANDGVEYLFVPTENGFTNDCIKAKVYLIKNEDGTKRLPITRADLELINYHEFGLIPIDWIDDF